jgi:hypothetical protein
MTDRQGTGFIVKAVSTTGLEMWIAVPRAGGHRVFGPREKADVFKTRSEAHSAIGKMPLAFEHAGFTFTVEAADG